MQRYDRIAQHVGLILLLQQRQASFPLAVLLACQLHVGKLTGFFGCSVSPSLLAAGMVIIKETWR